MSAKLNAIYAALDNGNTKSAVRLSEQFLAKVTPTMHYYHLVKALLALGLSRLGQSSEARAICEAAIEEQVLDPGAVETFGFVLKREGWYELQAKMTLAISEHPEVSPEVLEDCFYANLQNRSFQHLPKIALKLAKTARPEKEYLLWYAFGLSLSDDPKQWKLAVGLIDKILAKIDVPPGINRWSCGGRTELYLGKFRAQIVAKDISQTVAEDPIVNATGSSSLFGELQAMAPFTDQARFEACLCQYYDQSVVRSDCMVVLSEFLPWLKNPRKLLAHVLAAPKPTDGIAVVNRTKLLYGLDRSQITIPALVEEAKKFIESEHVLDECSPGKQLLLLAAILLLEEDKIPDALCVLSFGSRTFTHCSHFRLIECIVYARLGLAEKSLERFRALGVKNAQWRSLFWLVSGTLAKFYVPGTVQVEIRNEIETFLKRHRIEINSNLVLLVEEMAFFKFGEISKSVETSLDCAAHRWALRSADTGNSGFDYSPLLFLSIPEIGSGKKSECPVSPELVIGKWTLPVPEESNEVTWVRHRIACFDVSEETRESMSGLQAIGFSEFTTHVYMTVYDFMSNAPEFDASQVAVSFSNFPKLNSSMSFTNWLAHIAAWLNGPLEWMMDFVETKHYSRKSEESKKIRKFLSVLKELLENQIAETHRFESPVWQISVLEQNLSELTQNIQAEFASVRAGCRLILDRIGRY